MNREELQKQLSSHIQRTMHKCTCGAQCVVVPRDNKDEFDRLCAIGVERGQIPGNLPDLVDVVSVCPDCGKILAMGSPKPGGSKPVGSVAPTLEEVRDSFHQAIDSLTDAGFSVSSGAVLSRPGDPDPRDTDPLDLLDCPKCGCTTREVVLQSQDPVRYAEIVANISASGVDVDQSVCNTGTHCHGCDSYMLYEILEVDMPGGEPPAVDPNMN